jgi:hypothetical protein
MELRIDGVYKTLTKALVKLSPVGEEFGEVLLVVGHAGLLREEEDQQQLQEWQHVDPLAARRSEPSLPPTIMNVVFG